MYIHTLQSLYYTSNWAVSFYISIRISTNVQQKNTLLFFLVKKLQNKLSDSWLTEIFISAAVISPPVLRLNVTEEGIVVRVKPPKPNVRKMHSSLQYKIYLIHTSGEEVRTHTHQLVKSLSVSLHTVVVASTWSLNLCVLNRLISWKMVLSWIYNCWCLLNQCFSNFLHHIENIWPSKYRH